MRELGSGDGGKLAAGVERMNEAKQGSTSLDPPDGVMNSPMARRLFDDAVHGLWKIDCSPAIAQELWTWFDDCEQHSELLAREVWKVSVCQRAKERITRAM